MTLRLVRAALNGTSWVAPRVAGRATSYLFCNLKPRSKVHDSERETHQRAVLDELSVNGKKKVVTYRLGQRRTAGAAGARLAIARRPVRGLRPPP
jgi:hypothetical protein